MGNTLFKAVLLGVVAPLITARLGATLLSTWLGPPFDLNFAIGVTTYLYYLGFGAAVLSNKCRSDLACSATLMSGVTLCGYLFINDVRERLNIRKYLADRHPKNLGSLTPVRPSKEENHVDSDDLTSEDSSDSLYDMQTQSD